MMDDFAELTSKQAPDGFDRRKFMMRSALVGVMTAVTGCSPTESAQKAQNTPPPEKPATPSAPALSPDLDVVKREKGPVMTVLDEFYKVGPGPSSSHTIGPMRITYDFYQRATK